MSEEDLKIFPESLAKKTVIIFFIIFAALFVQGQISEYQFKNFLSRLPKFPATQNIPYKDLIDFFNNFSGNPDALGSFLLEIKTGEYAIDPKVRPERIYIFTEGPNPQAIDFSGFSSDVMLRRYLLTDAENIKLIAEQSVHGFGIGYPTADERIDIPEDFDWQEINSIPFTTQGGTSHHNFVNEKAIMRKMGSTILFSPDGKHYLKNQFTIRQYSDTSRRSETYVTVSRCIEDNSLEFYMDGPYGEEKKIIQGDVGYDTLLGLYNQIEKEAVTDSSEG